MKNLITIHAPEIFANLFGNLFAQVVAKHGYKNCVLIDTHNKVYIDEHCDPEALRRIVAEYTFHEQRITERTFIDYLDDLMTYELYEPEYYTPLKTLVKRKGL